MNTRQITPVDLVYIWMQSPGHRAIMLQEDALDIGCAVVESLAEDVSYIVMNIGFRENHWAGYSAVKTNDLVESIKAGFTFTDEEDLEKALKFKIMTET